MSPLLLRRLRSVVGFVLSVVSVLRCVCRICRISVVDLVEQKPLYYNVFFGAGESTNLVSVELLGGSRRHCRQVPPPQEFPRNKQKLGNIRVW